MVEHIQAEVEKLDLSPEQSSIIVQAVASRSIASLRRFVYSLGGVITLLVIGGLVALFIQSHDNAIAVHAAAHAQAVASAQLKTADQSLQAFGTKLYNACIAGKP